MPGDGPAKTRVSRGANLGANLVMCADPKMRGLLMKELREELAERRRARMASAPVGLPGRLRMGVVLAAPLTVAVALLASCL